MSEKISGGREKLDSAPDIKKTLGQTGLTADLILSEQASESSPVSEAKFFAHEIYDLQMDFAKRLQTLKDQDASMSEQEYERWEDDFSDNWKQIEKQVHRHNLSSSEEARAEEPMIAYTSDTELHKTVEAQAGRFYHVRQTDLRQAIGQSSQPEDVKQKDLNFIRGFVTAVARHLDFKYMSKSDINDYGPDRYESNRTRAHNEAIDYLNKLNDLARSYFVRPFTPREFWTSGVSNATPEMKRRMRYDRDIVEEYYELAFTSDVKRRKAKQEHDLKFGIY